MATSRHRAVIYARVSVASEKSVSVQRQTEAAESYAEARGWEIVGRCRDTGVSASKVRPEDREGWQEVLATPNANVVLIWKLDRLARNVGHFANTVESLQERGMSLAAVEDPVDMTTPTGKALAGLIAIFGQLEAETISARVQAARTHLLQNGRAVGGAVPYGWCLVPNPLGSGLVLAHDPERIDWVRGMVQRAQDGLTIYAIKQWLEREGAPVDHWRSQSDKAVDRRKVPKQRRGGWSYSSVERLLRNPILAGMRSFNPGNRSKVRGEGVLRDAKGMPVVDEAIAIMSADAHRRLTRALDARASAQSRPRSSKNATPAMLSGLATCFDCKRRLVRGMLSGNRPILRCPGCLQTIGIGPLTEHLVARLLSERGDHWWVDIEDITRGDNRVELADIEASLDAVGREIVADGADVPVLLSRLEALKDLRQQARAQRPSKRNFRFTSHTVAEVWQAASDDAAKRDVLTRQIASLEIARGKAGGPKLDTGRVRLTWVDLDEEPPEDAVVTDL